eukprot:7617283-Lingulodinium_polyedra.AAC.1
MQTKAQEGRAAGPGQSPSPPRGRPPACSAPLPSVKSERLRAHWCSCPARGGTTARATAAQACTSNAPLAGA